MSVPSIQTKYKDVEDPNKFSSEVFLRLKQYFDTGSEIPEVEIDLILGGQPTLTSVSEWKDYAIRKQELRKFLNKLVLFPELVSQYFNTKGI